MTQAEKEIAIRAKHALEQAGIQQVELARRIKRTGSTVTDYFNGSIRIPVVVLLEISQLTGRSLDYLIAGREGAKPAPKPTKEEALEELAVAAYRGDRKLAERICAAAGIFVGDRLTDDQKEILDLWAAADTDARDSAKYVLKKSADKSRKQDGGGSDLAGQNFA
jgi:transcriptional regulator with XRE-family HTH domain